ncbi:serine hydrolase [Sciscionella marina]|uniref:serine hydrolase n=1 Tax=Sciscionella marina TaxID=508770 RepID=UPI0003688BEC|nr:serine hydrolase [Sciscionella marina]
MLDRRTFLLASGLAGTAALTAGSLPAVATSGSSALGRFDLPQSGFAPATTRLRHGSPAGLGLDSHTIAETLRAVTGYTQPDNGIPLFPGAVTLLAHHGTILAEEPTGWALRYADREGTELPVASRIPMHADTIFDMASISKLFTTLVALCLLEEGAIALDTPVAKYLPGYETGGKAPITPKMLLTHTAGLPPDPKPTLWQGYPDIPARKKAILATKIKTEPGTAYEYSDLSMLSMQLLIEHVTGTSLDHQVHKRVVRPLGLRDTGYNPSPRLRERIAPTEYEVGEGSSNRGLVWGQVHDENAWSLGGVAGHAGVFSTAHDMAVIAQMVLNGGTYAGTRVLSEETAELIFTNVNTAFPDDAHGLGFELDQMFYMGALSSPETAGHTGFTGTTLVIDRLSRSIALLLTNRVHPNREGDSINPARQRVATGLARAMRVPPVAGNDYWTSQIGDDSTATLTTVPFDTGLRSAVLEFHAFVDTEVSDPLTVEFSTDAGKTWTPRAVTASGPGAPEGSVPSLSGHGHRRWWRVTASIPEAARAPRMQVRWRYTTDKQYTGRGVCVDKALMYTGRQKLFDLEHDPGAVTGDGWARARH